MSTPSASWTPFCGKNGSPHNHNFIQCPNCGAVNPRSRIAQQQQVPVPEIIDVDAHASPLNCTRPSAVTVAALPPRTTATGLQRFQSYQGRQVDRQGPRTPAAAASAPADGIFRACAHFYLHLFDTVGGVRMYTRIQSVGMKKFLILSISQLINPLQNRRIFCPPSSYHALRYRRSHKEPSSTVDRDGSPFRFRATSHRRVSPCNKAFKVDPGVPLPWG